MSVAEPELVRKAGRPEMLLDAKTHYCPGCGHGTVHRLIAEIIGEMDIRDRTIGMAPVGCAVMAYNYIDVDMSEAAHGRTPAVATGIKRVYPDHLVFSYQGDGDLAAIGTNEIIHCANRGEGITVIFVNNTVYGMTGGQMAPTTLDNQKTSTSPLGRSTSQWGHPIRVCELLATLPHAVYLERTMITTPKWINKTKKAIRKAFQYQLDKKGFTLVEVLSPCPTYWRMSPEQAIDHLENTMTKFFPVGVIKDDPEESDWPIKHEEHRK